MSNGSTHSLIPTHFPVSPQHSATTMAGSGLTFGTYRVSGEAAAGSVTRALEAGIRRIDTAQLYKNEPAVFNAVRRFEAAHPEIGSIHVCTKIFKRLLFDQTIRAVANSAERLGRPLDLVLLHRPLPVMMWRALSACVERGLAKEIGVSNYSAARLTELLSDCEGNRGAAPCRPPAVNQIELHPFVGPVLPLLSLCRAQHIRVQGHTVLAQGRYFDFPPLVRLAASLGASPAVVLLRWAQQLGAEVVFHTSQDLHLREILWAAESAEPTLGPRDIAEICGYYAIKTQRFFPEATSPVLDAELASITDTAQYVTAVAQRLNADRDAMERGLPVSNTALNLLTSSNLQLLTDPVANQLALRLFPLEVGADAAPHYDRFRDLIRKLRSRAQAQRAGQLESKQLSCSLQAHKSAPGPVRFVNGESVSKAVAYPEPMPVAVAPAQELAPFLAFLRNPGKMAESPSSSTEGPLVFTRGAYFPDQRMDLCKQVVGPDHIESLCDAVGQPFDFDAAPRWGLVRHFLLGNNLACAGDSITGARSMARLMSNPRAAIETWYLAGNCIGPQDIGVLADALEDNVHARALWLKRNPLGADGGAHLGRLLSKNRSLRLLDVDNTGLFDEGIEALARAFAAVHGVLRLRHLYAAANALTERSLAALLPVLTAQLPQPCSLVSLSLSINRLGNAGYEILVGIIATGALANLERLDLGSIGLNRTDLTRLSRALIQHCSKLRSLNLGTYLSTRDLGEKANHLDSDVTALEHLLRNHPALELLDVSICGLPSSAIERLVAACGTHQSLHGAGGLALHHTGRQRRFLKHPRRVVHIDSIYRGRS